MEWGWGVREGGGLEVDTSFASRRVTRVLEQIIAERGVPQAIRCDNGPEFTSRHFLVWCVEPGGSRSSTFSPGASFYCLDLCMIEAQVQTPNQLPDQTRAMIFVDQLFDIDAAQNQLLAVDRG